MSIVLSARVGGRLLGRLRPRRGSLIAGVVLLSCVVAACALVPVLAGASATQIVAPPFTHPSAAHWFGTDDVGRDVFVRTMAGGRIDIMASVVTVLVSFGVGTAVGIVAGYTRLRWLDALISRVIDGIIAFPFIILILALIVIFGQERGLGPVPAGLPAAVVAFCVAGWVYYARLARGQTLSVKERDFVLAARLMGYPTWRVLLRHLAPSVVKITLSYAVLDAVAFVLLLASLAFLGASVQPPTPEWGAIMYGGRNYLDTAWWITVLPGCVLVVFGVALTLIADGLLGGDDR